jgi:AcrR family transcriptional regulator
MGRNRETPRERRHARTKQEIVNAALQIVVEQGVAALSIRTLAQKIDYSPSGLYEYFASKDEIMQAICEDGLEQLSTHLMRVSPDISPSQQLLEAGQIYLDFAYKHREQYFLMFGQSQMARFSLHEVNESQSYQQLKHIIQRGIQLQEFRVSDDYGVDEMTYHCWTQLHGMAMLRLANLTDTSGVLDTLNGRVLRKLVASLQAA